MPAWVLEVSRHSRGPGALAWRGVRSIGRLASPARGVEWGRVPRRAIQRVGRAPCHPRRGVGADAGASRGGRLADDEPAGAAGSSGRGAFWRWFSVHLPLGQWCPVGATPVRFPSSPPSHFNAHRLWRERGRGICRCSGRVRSNPSHFPVVHFLSVKGCQDVSGVETRETPASWEASVAASSMARGSIYTLSTLNHANQDASVHGTRSLSNPTANGLLKIDDWQLKAIAHHPVVPHFQCSGPVSTLQRPGKSGTSGTPLSPPPPQTVCGCVVGLDHARCRSVRKKNGARPGGNVQNKTATCPSRKTANNSSCYT